MFNFEEKVIVDFGDIAHFAKMYNDGEWNHVHNMIFNQPYSFFHDAGLVDYEGLADYDLEQNVVELIRAFMDHIEVEEFYWVAR